jgi:hypothetical protein
LPSVVLCSGFRETASERTPFIARGLKRYLLAVSYGHTGGWGIYDAPEPWGPWTTAFHTEYWGLGMTHGYRLPSKWISPDGKDMALVFSGLVYDTVSYDAFCMRKMKLETR